MSQMPDWRAKNAVFESIIDLLVVNQLTLGDLQAYVDAAEVMQEFLSRKGESPDITLERLFQVKSLAIAQFSGGSYIECRVQLMGHALHSLTRGHGG